MAWILELPLRLLIEVVETVTEWVCEEVVGRILVAIEVLIEYVFYILQGFAGSSTG